MKRLKLSTQIIIIFLACVIIVPLILFGCILPVYKTTVAKSIFETLDYQLTITAADNTEFLNSVLILSPMGEIDAYELKEEDRNITAAEISEIVATVKNLEEGSYNHTIKLGGGGNVFFAVKVYSDRSARVVFTTFTTASTIFGDEQSIRFVGLTSLFMAIPIILIMIWFIYVSRSINSIEKSIIGGETQKYIASKELQSLSDSIDIYKSEINSDTEQKQRLFQNISHELKTPITTIRMYAEGLEDGIYKENDIKKSTGIIKEETDVLLERVNKIMDINKLYHAETKQIEMRNERVILSEVIFDCLEKYNKRAPDVRFDAKLERNEWRGNKEIWTNVIQNVFDNNIKHGAKNIYVVMDKNLLTIENDGDRIEPEVLDKIFDPFIKGQNGNFGLGLNIIQRSLALLGYSIEVKNTKTGVMYKIR